jgi:hypothetical protein
MTYKLFRIVESLGVGLFLRKERCVARGIVALRQGNTESDCSLYTKSRLPLSCPFNWQKMKIPMIKVNLPTSWPWV